MSTSRARYRDRLGKPVPTHLNIVWRGRERLEEMRMELRKWRGALAGGVMGAMQEQSARTFSAFQGIPVKEISKLVEQIDRLLGGSMPQMVCNCRTKWCEWCEGKGWLNALDARRISNRGQLSALSESLSPPQPSVERTPLAEQSLSSATTRFLWLLAGPPEVNLPPAGPAMSSPLTESSASTET